MTMMMIIIIIILIIIIIIIIITLHLIIGSVDGSDGMIWTYCTNSNKCTE